MKRFETLNEALKYTGAEGELTAVIGYNAWGVKEEYAFTLFLHDGKTAGGIPMNSTGGLYNKDVSQTHAAIHFYDTSRATISAGDEHHIGVAYPNITHSATGRILDAAVQVSYDAAHMTGGDTAVPFIDIRITERPDTYVSKFSSAILRLYADGKVVVITSYNNTSSIKELASSVWTYPTSPIANKASIQKLGDGSEDKHYYGDGSENEQ